MKESEYYRQLKLLRKREPDRRIDLIGTCSKCHREDRALMWTQPRGARVATAECSLRDGCARALIAAATKAAR